MTPEEHDPDLPVPPAPEADPEQTVECLVLRVRAGDRDAAAEFVRRFWPRVRRRVRRRLGSKMRRLYDSDDIMATVCRRFDRLVDRQGVRAGSEVELESLVRRIVGFAVADKSREFDRLTRVERRDSQYRRMFWSSRHPDPAEMRLRIERLCAVLEDEDDQLTLRMRLRGERFESIAAVLGVDVQTTRQRWRQIKEHLRRAGETVDDGHSPHPNPESPESD